MKNKKFKLFSGIILASAAASLIHSGGEFFNGVSLFNPLVNYAESSGASVGDNETTVTNFEVTGDVKFYRTNYFVINNTFRDLTDQSYEISVNQTVRDGDKIVIKTKGLRLGLLDTYNIYANDSEKVVAKLKLKSVKDNIPNNGVISDEARNSTSGKAEKEAVYELVFTKEAENYKNLRIKLKYNNVPTFANPFITRRSEESRINFDYLVEFGNKTVINKSRKLLGYEGYDKNNPTQGDHYVFRDTVIDTTPYDFKFSGEILETLSSRRGNSAGDYQPVKDVKTVDTGIGLGANIILDENREDTRIQGIKVGDEIELNYTSEDLDLDLNNKFSVNNIITLKEIFSNGVNFKNFTPSDQKLLLKSNLLFKVKILEKEKTNDNNLKLKVKIEEMPDGLVGKTFDLGELVSFNIKNNYSGTISPRLQLSSKIIRDGNIVNSKSDDSELLFSKAKLLEASGDKFKTVYQDEDGNQLKEEIGIKTDLSEIDGYKFIRKQVNNSGDLVATFHKKKTRFVYHENNNAAAIDIKALDGVHEKEEIDGYVYSRSEVSLENGDTIHHYFKKLPNKVTNKAIPSPIIYEKDATREKGQPNLTTNGEPGNETITTTYSVNPQTGVVTPTVGNPVRTKEPTPTKVKVAAKDKVVERELPNITRYVKDSEKAFGTPNETQTEGHPGREVTRTVYTVNPTDGTITEKTTTTRESEPQDKVIKVGTKRAVRNFKDTEGRNVTEITDYNVDDNGVVIPTTTRTYGNQKDSTEVHKGIPSPIIYEKDDTREKGQPNLTTNGEPGDEVTTTTYSVDPQTGKITPTVGKPVRVKEPTPTKVKVAAKDKVVGRELPNRTRYIKDSEKAFGTPNETQTEGHPGREVTRTVYTVNPTDGTITEKTTTTRESEPQDKIIKVGTKRLVRNFKDTEGRNVTETTDYNVDETTGVVSPTVTRSYGNQKDSTEVHKSIPSPVVYEKDETRNYGEPNQTVNGEPGDEVTTTTYSVDPQTGTITPTVGKPVRVKEPTPTKVKVAAKDKVVENELPNKIHYVKDSEKAFGTLNETQTEGHPGREVTRTVYTVNPTDGTITEKTTTTRESEPQDGTIKVGAKNKVETYKDDEGRTVNKITEYNVDETTGAVTPSTTITYGDKKDSTEVHKSIPSPVVYEKDETRDYGEPNETVNGEPGDEVTTTTYSVDPKTGKITSTVGNPVIKKEPTSTKVKVAGKTKVVETEIPYKTTYVEDEGADFGTPNKIQEGVPGKEKTTTTYFVDPKTGEVTSKEEKTKVSDPQNKTVKVGTKPKIEQITENGNLYEVKTIYKLNKETGEITPETTKRFIKKVQGETKEPTVKAALNTGVDASSNIFPILSLIGMTGGIVLPIRLKKKD